MIFLVSLLNYVLQTKEVDLNPVVDPGVVTSLLAQNLTISGKHFVAHTIEVQYHRHEYEGMYYMGYMDGPALNDYNKYRKGTTYSFLTPPKLFMYHSFYQQHHHTFKLISNFSAEDSIHVKLKYLIGGFHQANCFEVIVIALVFVSIFIEIFYFHFLAPNYECSITDSLAFFEIFVFLFMKNISMINENDIQNIIYFCIFISIIYNSNNILSSIPFIFYSLFDQTTKSYYCLFLILLIIHQNIIHTIILIFFYYISTHYPNLSFSYIIILYYFINFKYYNKNISKSNSKSKPDSYSIKSIVIVLIWSLIILILELYNSHISNPMNIIQSHSFNNRGGISIHLQQWYPENNTFYFKDLVHDMVDEIQKPFTIDAQCPHCDFKPINGTSSTERDLIIIQAGGVENKGIISIRTLRTTGCKARIFLCVHKGEFIKSKIKRQLELCGVKIFYVKNIKGLKIGYHKNTIMATMRFLINEEFLYKASKYVDRMLYFDTKDTVFQADPFNDITTPNSLYVSPEFRYTSTNKIMQKWYRQLPNFNGYYFKNCEVICNGIFAGDTPTMIKLGQLMKSLHLGLDFIATDQAQYDYLIYSGIFAKAGVNVIRYPKYASIADISKQFKPLPLGEVKHPKLSYPVAIHQYNRWDLLVEKFEGCCK